MPVGLLIDVSRARPGTSDEEIEGYARAEGGAVSTLRHTAATLIVAKGVPLLAVARVIGHCSIHKTMRSAHYAPDARSAAIERLGAALAIVGAR
mgnify:FL=1